MVDGKLAVAIAWLMQRSRPYRYICVDLHRRRNRSWSRLRGRHGLEQVALALRSMKWTRLVSFFPLCATSRVHKNGACKRRPISHPRNPEYGAPCMHFPFTIYITVLVESMLVLFFDWWWMQGQSSHKARAPESRNSYNRNGLAGSAGMYAHPWKSGHKSIKSRSTYILFIHFVKCCSISRNSCQVRSFPPWPFHIKCMWMGHDLFT